MLLTVNAQQNLIITTDFLFFFSPLISDTDTTNFVIKYSEFVIQVSLSVVRY